MNSFAGTTVALAEGRQLLDLSAMLEAEGAVVLRYPLLSILDAPDESAVHAWLDELIADSFALLVLMTGEAVRRLVGFAERAHKRDAFLAALARTPTLARGPKPGQALKELGLKPTRIAGSPTTQGVIDALVNDDLAGKKIAVTLYATENKPMQEFLSQRGAIMCPVLSYVYAPASDDQRVTELIHKLDDGEVSVFVFTSSPQVDRLLEVAKAQNLEAKLHSGLGKTKIAAVGPLIADRLREAGAKVDIVPEQGWVMKNLVRRIVREMSQ
jgi:uroporphyrinogen-III synthase